MPVLFFDVEEPAIDVFIVLRSLQKERRVLHGVLPFSLGSEVRVLAAALVAEIPTCYLLLLLVQGIQYLLDLGVNAIDVGQLLLVHAVQLRHTVGLRSFL